jgi:hypothetical protein
VESKRTSSLFLHKDVRRSGHACEPAKPTCLMLLPRPSAGTCISMQNYAVSACKTCWATQVSLRHPQNRQTACRFGSREGLGSAGSNSKHPLLPRCSILSSSPTVGLSSSLLPPCSAPKPMEVPVVARADARPDPRRGVGESAARLLPHGA